MDEKDTKDDKDKEGPKPGDSEKQKETMESKQEVGGENKSCDKKSSNKEGPKPGDGEKQQEDMETRRRSRRRLVASDDNKGDGKNSSNDAKAEDGKRGEGTKPQDGEKKKDAMETRRHSRRKLEASGNNKGDGKKSSNDAKDDKHGKGTKPKGGDTQKEAMEAGRHSRRKLEAGGDNKGDGKKSSNDAKDGKHGEGMKAGDGEKQKESVETKRHSRRKMEDGGNNKGDGKKTSNDAKHGQHGEGTKPGDGEKQKGAMETVRRSRRMLEAGGDNNDNGKKSLNDAKHDKHGEGTKPGDGEKQKEAMETERHSRRKLEARGDKKGDGKKASNNAKDGEHGAGTKPGDGEKEKETGRHSRHELEAGGDNKGDGEKSSDAAKDAKPGDGENRKEAMERRKLEAGGHNDAKHGKHGEGTKPGDGEKQERAMESGRLSRRKLEAGGGSEGDGKKSSMPVAVGVPVGVSTDEQVRKLREQGFTGGLIKALSFAKNDFPLRIWVVDNSGSMKKEDGHLVTENPTTHNVEVRKCSRWRELQDCIEYHVDLAALLRAPTKFRLLNDPGVSAGRQYFQVAEPGSDDKAILKEVEDARNVMRKAIPRWKTPLTKHILDIRKQVRGMSNQLKLQDQRVAVIIATDGLPTDPTKNVVGEGNDAAERFVNALKSLEGLPVWIVIRICTDDARVVAFYHGLDEQLELSIELLDDFTGEAVEVHKQNRWLNYALPLHRCRELGFHHKVFDLIDERPLTRDQLRDFCSFLFGEENFGGAPDPAVDWMGFRGEVQRLLQAEKEQWNPATRKLSPWIDMDELDKRYGDEASCSCLVA